MIKRIGRFFEEHIEKIILIIVGVLCAWLLVTRVLLSPNVVEYKSKNYTPVTIDKMIYEDAKELDNQKASPDIPEIVIPQKSNYTELFESSLKDIELDFPPLTPLNYEPDISSEYPEPKIGTVTDVDIEFTRAVVYEPTIEVTREKPYQSNLSEPNDLDFVTIEAKYDIANLYKEFYRCYNGAVSEALANQGLDTPIFASVNVQRKRKLNNNDDTWSEWENVPRAKIDYNKDLFKVVENFSDLPLGGLKVYTFRLNDKLTQLELLQPEPYQIASANKEWLPPKLHREFITAQKKDERTAKEEERANEINRTTDTTSRRRDRINNRKYYNPQREIRNNQYRL